MSEPLSPIAETQIYHPIRWVLLRDMSDIVRIDNYHVWDRWSESTYNSLLRNGNVIGSAYEGQLASDPIRAFAVYTLQPNSLYLNRIAVSPESLRKGLGRALVERLLGKLNASKRTRLIVDVPERNLTSQKFFAACGMKARQQGDVIRFVKRLEMIDA